MAHASQGNPCTKCGLPEGNHRPKHGGRSTQTVYAGVDGEGQGRKTHRYVLLGAATEDGSRSWYVEDFNGLPTKRCLDFLLNLPKDLKLFAYSFNYDLTKILQDVDDKTLYYLLRPELRPSLNGNLRGPRPMYWEGYFLNIQATKFTIRKGKRYRVVWDVFRFFQGKFTGALRDWRVGAPGHNWKSKDRITIKLPTGKNYTGDKGDPEYLVRMAAMKDQRKDFDRLSPIAVRDYCLDECRCMGELARKLVDAHQEAGLELKNFYGAGSSAAAMLQKMGVKDKIIAPPPELARAIAQAFFGGRFENSVVGPVRGKVFNYDISSAYPYQLCFLPCLEHGRWEHTTNRADLERSRTALVRYRLNLSAKVTSWAPFPFRTKDGSITFPRVSGGGWIWRDEYLAGERIFPTEFLEAWVYRADCNCQPFSDIPGYYLERLRIGKEGPGIVLKLGMNSCYGKLAQSIGQGQFNSWVWAGLITSGTRAQILDMLGLHKDHSNLLMVATDGIYTREELDCPKPLDTGTDVEVIDQSTGETVRKPLGGWEKSTHERGVFVARPGIYFPLGPTAEDLKKVRARGIGKSVVLEQWKFIIKSWERNRDREAVHLAKLVRFSGAKSCIGRRETGGDPKEKVKCIVMFRESGLPIYRHKFRQGVCKVCGAREEYRRANGSGDLPGHMAPNYGQWIERPVDMTFDPQPKRELIMADNTMSLRVLDHDTESRPYDKAILSEQAMRLKALEQELEEQPDTDYTEYD